MIVQGWHYYNHAAIPNCAPHEEVDLTAINDGSIWKMDGGPLFARWTEDFDCKEETNWWYTIQDKPFDLMSVNSRYRNRINKGLKNFQCRRINPAEFAEDMADITLLDWQTYPAQYRPTKTRDELVEAYKNWSLITHGAFDIEDGKLCAFHGIQDCGAYYMMVSGKSIPEKQKGQLNAALIYSYITDIGRFYKDGKYLSNGQRNLNHDTNFNDDLCKYYGFRKAFCKLRVKYNPRIEWIVKASFPFRRVLLKFDKYTMVHNLNVILKMEEIVRNQQ